MDKLSEHISNLKYFHSERGDMTRYHAFKEVIDMFPDLNRAYKDFLYAKKVLDLVIEKEIRKYDD